MLSPSGPILPSLSDDFAREAASYTDLGFNVYDSMWQQGLLKAKDI